MPGTFYIAEVHPSETLLRPWEAAELPGAYLTYFSRPGPSWGGGRGILQAVTVEDMASGAGVPAQLLHDNNRATCFLFTMSHLQVCSLTYSQIFSMSHNFVFKTK